MALDDKTVKIVLDERDLPTHWYNIVPDLPNPPAPPLHPGTGQPLGPADLAPLFPMGIIMQEVSQEPRIEIPDQVRDIYRLWRPTPLYRARRLEQALDTRPTSTSTTTSTRASRRPAATCRTRPSPRPTTTILFARIGRPPRPGPA